VAKVRIFTCILALILGACSEPPADEPSESVEDRVARVANEFVDGYYSHYPEDVYETGYPDAPMDRFGDHSEESDTAWDTQVDHWLAELNGIEPSSISGTATALAYVFTRAQMQALVDRRVCQQALWNISPTWTGWQYMVASTLAIQPVGTAEQRADALARAVDTARFVKTEVSNLRRGLDQGYAAGANNVTAVIDQISSLIDTPTPDSPFYSPAARADDEEFIAAYTEVLESDLRDAMIAYRDFLANDYQGHDGPGVGANPDGARCYAASVRYWASSSMAPDEIHRKGLSEMARIQSEMLEIAQASFGTDDVKALLAELRSNPEYTFASEQEMVDYITEAVGRGKAAVGDWFGYVPEAELRIVQSPAYKKDSGGGFYSVGLADGSRPGIYTIGTYNPTAISKAGPESTAFHESYPGHHLQMTVALRNESAHPIFRYITVSGTVEGWALYTERLADEMGLYSSDLARLGMLSNEAYRAARLVIDPGMHVMGWTRDEAIQYMLDHTTESRGSVQSEVDRYSAVPGQATSYLIGSLEIQRLRKRAEEALGDDFDIREFHDRILAAGGVTLPMLGATIEAWISRHAATAGTNSD
jgi:uncharacterized protein (DUF885 family)